MAIRKDKYGNAWLSDMHIQNTHHFSNAQIVYGDKVIDILQKEDVSHGETTRVKAIILKNSCQNKCPKFKNESVVWIFKFWYNEFHQ